MAMGNNHTLHLIEAVEANFLHQALPVFTGFSHKLVLDSLENHFLIFIELKVHRFRNNLKDHTFVLSLPKFDLQRHIQSSTEKLKICLKYLYFKAVIAEKIIYHWSSTGAIWPSFDDSSSFTRSVSFAP